MGFNLAFKGLMFTFSDETSDKQWFTLKDSMDFHMFYATLKSYLDEHQIPGQHHFGTIY